MRGMSADEEFEFRRGYRNGIHGIVWTDQLRDTDKWEAAYRARHDRFFVVPAGENQLSDGYMAGWIKAGRELSRRVEEREIRRASERYES